MTRTGVIRVAGLLQRLVRHGTLRQPNPYNACPSCAPQAEQFPNDYGTTPPRRCVQESLEEEIEQRRNDSSALRSSAATLLGCSKSQRASFRDQPSVRDCWPR